MKISKVISTRLKNARRFIKILINGRDDVQEINVVSPYGVDSNPVKNMIALYSSTSEKGKAVVIGYVNKSALADIGELRLFSTDADGDPDNGAFIHLKNDGTAEMLGTGDFMVRFNALETGFNQLRSDHNAFLTHVHGAAGTPPAPPAPTSTASISSAKIDEIKTLP